MVDHLAEVRSLNLPAGTYLVVGGSCLAVRGIRESNDIDIVVTPETFELLRERGWEIDALFKEKWNRERLKHGLFEIYTDMVIESEDRYVSAADLIQKAEMLEGIPFLSLPDLMYFKRDNARPKDLEDIASIENYLRTHV